LDEDVEPPACSTARLIFRRDDSPVRAISPFAISPSTTIPIQAGSDIGFWSESGFADNFTFKNNRFTHSITDANGAGWRGPPSL
jgi:hypothetical protein